MSKLIQLVLAACLFAGTAAAHAERQVIVNQQRLSDTAVTAIEQYYGVPVRNGRYWYDTASGLWGPQGGPAAGRMEPGYNLGRLHSNASGGVTNVVVNGRRIHPTELQFLQRCYGYVQPASYWMNARGVSGFIGGPAQFDVTRCFGGQGGGGGGGGRRESLLSGYFLTGVSVLGN